MSPQQVRPQRQRADPCRPLAPLAPAGVRPDSWLRLQGSPKQGVTAPGLRGAAEREIVVRTSIDDGSGQARKVRLQVFVRLDGAGGGRQGIDRQGASHPTTDPVGNGCDRSKRSTTLRLVGDDVEATESRLLTKSRRRITLRPDLDATAESMTDGNDGFIRFLRLPGQRSSKLDLLKGNTAQDVVWVWAAIGHWRRGGPHDMALHLSALARRR